MKVLGEGPIPARIMLVAEAPGAEEDRAGKPFVGSSGQELTRMLHEAGIIRSECFITNVCRFRPPNNDIEQFIPVRKGDITPECVYLHDRYVKPVVYQGYEELLREIALVQPHVIVACGNVSLWALTGKWGITSWRGSLLESFPIPGLARRVKVIPTYHPAAILRQWDWRAIAVNDLRRVKRESETVTHVKPNYRFWVRPTYKEVMERLDALYIQCEQGPLDLAVDLETRRKHIACLGVGWNAEEALCIPFMCVERKDGYWPEWEEAEIIYTLSRLLTHPNCRVIGQNFLYDTQYIWKHWGFIPNFQWDTMMAHHLMFVLMPKGLHFLSSLYCDNHVYWKDEGKEWDPSVPEEQLWRYNCQDCVRTWEIKREEARSLTQMGLDSQHQFKIALWWACLESMIRGMRINHSVRPAMAAHFAQEMKSIEDFLQYVLGHPLKPRSHVQMKKLFYVDLRQPVQLHKRTRQPTLDDQALEKLGQKEPLLRPLISAIGDHRSLGVFKSTFVEAELDDDGRMRCTIDPNGTSTYRLATYENAFGTGMNMQNIPSDKSKAIGKAAKRVRVEGMELKLPNLRELFLPDEGKLIWDADLDRADLQVVVWEADDSLFKLALQRGVDIHLLNAFVLSGVEPPDLEELIEGGSKHDRYLHWRSKYKLLREFAKVFCHGTNYGGSAKTMAGHCGVLVHEAEKAQKIWFGAHPGIKAWHRRTGHELMTRRAVSNKFGYTAIFFDRVETLLPEALAWVPQSTVAEVINRGWINLLANQKDNEVLIQVHDSLVGQFDSKLDRQKKVEEIKRDLSILIPYDDPLVIPVGVKLSEKSWGTVK